MDLKTFAFNRKWPLGGLFSIGAFVAAAVASSACSMHDAGSKSEGTGGSGATGGSAGSTSPDERATASGAVTRAAPIAPGNDGKGTLVVGVFEACSQTAKLLGAAIEPRADLSAESASVPFAISGLPRVEVHLAAFLDDDGNLDSGRPAPSAGDLVYGEGAGDGVLDCVSTDLAAGDRTGVAIELNLVED
jgi:hypothetical protein